MLDLERIQPYHVPEVFPEINSGGFTNLSTMLFEHFTKEGKSVPKMIDIKAGAVAHYSASAINMKSGNYKCRRRTSREVAVFSKDHQELVLLIDELSYKSDNKVDSRPSFLSFSMVIEVFKVTSDMVNEQNYHQHFKHLIPDRTKMTFGKCKGTFYLPDRNATTYSAIDEICRKHAIKIRPFRETMDYPLFYSDEEHFMYLAAYQNSLN